MLHELEEARILGEEAKEEAPGLPVIPGEAVG